MSEVALAYSDNIDTIFNTRKTDYENQSLFLGQAPGLLDTVNKNNPELWKLYKTMKSQDWDENEFDYSSCLVDFEACSPAVYDMMIKTLAWQWETDSAASHGIVPIIAPFSPNTTVWVGWQRIADNESIHGLTYSEIVRNSFANPQTILAEVLAVKESLSRLHEIASVFAQAKSVGIRLQTGELSRDSDEAYDAIFMFTVAMLVLERIQFMASFAITFAIVDTGLFQPIGKAVQKIAQDELEVHCRWDMAILTHEMSTPRGRSAFKRLSPRILELIKAVERSEVTWVEYMFSEGRELLGMNAKLLKAWVYFNSACVRQYFGFALATETPSTNPLRFMSNWLDISKTQSSPQEQDNGQYRMNTMRRTDDNVEFAVDF